MSKVAGMWTVTELSKAARYSAQRIHYFIAEGKIKVVAADYGGAAPGSRPHVLIADEEARRFIMVANERGKSMPLDELAKFFKESPAQLAARIGQPLPVVDGVERVTREQAVAAADYGGAAPGSRPHVLITDAEARRFIMVANERGKSMPLDELARFFKESPAQLAARIGQPLLVVDGVERVTREQAVAAAIDKWGDGPIAKMRVTDRPVRMRTKEVHAACPFYDISKNKLTAPDIVRWMFDVLISRLKSARAGITRGPNAARPPIPELPPVYGERTCLACGLRVHCRCGNGHLYNDPIMADVAREKRAGRMF